MYCQVEERDRGKLKTQNGNKTDCFISRQKVVEGICQYNTIRMGISSLSLSSRSVVTFSQTWARMRRRFQQHSLPCRPPSNLRIGWVTLYFFTTHGNKHDLAVQQLCGPDQSTLTATIHQRCLWRLHCCWMFVRILLVCRCWP